MRPSPFHAALAAALLLGGCQATPGPTVALSLPSAEKSGCLTIFAAWDLDRSGRLSRPEFDAAALRAANWSVAERQELFRRLDGDRDGAIDEAEAGAGCETLEAAARLRGQARELPAPAPAPSDAPPEPTGGARSGIDCDAELRAADADGDATITLGEFLAISDFGAIGDASLSPEHMFQLADTDRDGRLSRTEVCLTLPSASAPPAP